MGCCGAPPSLSPSLCLSDCPSNDGYTLNTVREHSEGRQLQHVLPCQLHPSLQHLSAPCHTRYEIGSTKEDFQKNCKMFSKMHKQVNSEDKDAWKRILIESIPLLVPTHWCILKALSSQYQGLCVSSTLCLQVCTPRHFP